MPDSTYLRRADATRLKAASALDPERSISLKLSGAVYRELAAEARRSRVTLEVMAETWLHAAAERGATRVDEGFEGEARSLLEQQQAALERGLERIARLEILSAGYLAGVSHDRPLAERNGWPEPGGVYVDGPGGDASLHEEITSVLREAGRPMSTTQIADSVRQRNRYRARKRGPVTAAIVRGRVIHPRYRDHFARIGRLVGLAEWQAIPHPAGAAAPSASSD